MAPSIQLDPPLNDYSSAPPYSPYSPFTPSPFLSQSFGRTLDSATLGSISETTSLRRRGSIEDESSRPLTPDAQFQLYMGVGQGRPDRVVSEGSSNDTGWGRGDGGDQFRTASNPAPFRRAIGADDDDQGGPSTTVEDLGEDGSPPISSTEQSPNLREGGGGGGADKENQRPFVSFPKSSHTPSTSIAPFEPRRPQLKQLGESTLSFPSSSSGGDQTPEMSIDELGGGGPNQGGGGGGGGLPPFRSRLSSRFDSNAPLPPAGLMRTRLESRFSISTLTSNELVGEASTNGSSAGAGGGGGGRPRASSLS